MTRFSMPYESALDAVKGWFHMSALDKSAPLSATLVTAGTSIPAGRVATLNVSGEFEVDRVANASNPTTAMPIFLWNGSDSLDVSNDGLSATDGTTRNWISINPSNTKIMSGLVATGGYELQTTEYDSAATADYTVNALLTSTTTGLLTADGVAPGGVEQFVDWVCGICSTHVQSQAGYLQPGNQAAASGPLGTNAHGMSTLTFWSYFLPADSGRDLN